MKIGLTVIDQVRSGGKPNKSLGGYAAQSFEELVAQIPAAYHTEHNSDDTHATITASGSVTERGRVAAMGEWADVTYASTLYTALPGSAWIVTASNQQQLSYALVGTTMTVSWLLYGTRLASAACARVNIAIPLNGMAVRHLCGTFGYSDNGTRGTGVCQVRPNNGNVIELYKDLDGNGTWSESAGLSVAGQLAFDVTGID